MTAPTPTTTSTTAPARWVLGPARLAPGDRIEVWEHRRPRYTGTVSQVAPHLGVLWVRESRSGLPKLIPAQEYRLRHALTVQVA